MRRLTLGLVVALTLTACTGETTSTTAASSTSSTSEAATSTNPPSTPQDVTFPTADSVTLEATLRPGNHIWVILAHMRPADRTSWDEFATELHGLGYSVLAYDNRGYGGSEGEREPFELKIDASAALRYAYENGARRVVFGGASMNGATVSALSGFYEFDAALVLSGVRTFGKVANITSALADSSHPILFVAAQDDGAAVQDAEVLTQAAPSGDLIVLSTGGHGTDMLENDPTLSARIIEWLENVLG